MLTAEVVEPAPVFRIMPATPHDVPAILAMIEALVDYEELRPLCVATEGDLRAALFGSRPAAEVLLGWEAQTVVASAPFFHNFSTFLGRKGLYLEDLFVRPSYRRRGYGRALLIHLVRIAVDRGCGLFEWAVLGWNAPAIAFYQPLGGVAAGLAHRSPHRSGTGRPRDRRAEGS